MNTKGVEDGTDEQAVRDFFEGKGLVVRPPTKNYPTWDLFRRGTMKGSGASELLMWADARAKLPTMRSATPEELTAQAESYGKNYRPGPRQATPFMPKDAEARAVCDEMIENLRHNVAAERERCERAVPVEERTATPLFNDPAHMIGAILDRIDMAPNDDPIPYIREYVDGLRERNCLAERPMLAPIPEERTAEMPSLSPEMDDLVVSLREYAMTATRGQWEAVDDVMGGNFVMEVDGGDPIAETERPRDMRYIAAASPENILKLLDHIEGKPK